MTRKIFGDIEPMGSTIDVRGWTSGSYTVTGVIECVPDNAHFTFSFVTSLVSGPEYIRSLEDNNWTNANWYTYILLRDGVDRAQLEEKMPSFEAKYTDIGPCYRLAQRVLSGVSGGPDQSDRCPEM